MARRPADPEEELGWMAQDVCGYAEAVLNSLAANVPKAVVPCQVEKAKEDMLNKLYSSVRIEEMLLEEQNVKRRRERYQKQSSLLSKLTRQLSIHDNWYEWRSAFDSRSNGHGDPEQNGDINSGLLSIIARVAWLLYFKVFPASLNDL